MEQHQVPGPESPVITLSPLDYHVSQFVHAGATLREIATRAEVPRDTCFAALKSLEGLGLIAFREDEIVVDASQCRSYHQFGKIRRTDS